MDVVISKNNVPIRLTYERWIHITESHDDLAGHHDDILEVIEDPDYIVRGYKNSLIALKRVKGNKFFAVVYKELDKEDGFVITAYSTSKLKLEKEVILWQKK